MNRSQNKNRMKRLIDIKIDTVTRYRKQNTGTLRSRNLPDPESVWSDLLMKEQ